jgi:hypothetical protein
MYCFLKIGLTLCAAIALEDKEAVVNCCQIRLSFTRGRSRHQALAQIGPFGIGGVENVKFFVGNWRMVSSKKNSNQGSQI